MKNRKVTWGNKISKGKKGKRTSIKTEFKKGHKVKEEWLITSNLGRFKSGHLHSQWLGGKSFEPYTADFNNKFKRKIRKRDNYICIKCGIHQEKLSRTLTIHHINYNKKLSLPQNCCTLCSRCNLEVNFNRKHWTKFFQSLLSEKYNYKYSKEEEVILNE